MVRTSIPSPSEATLFVIAFGNGAGSVPCRCATNIPSSTTTNSRSPSMPCSFTSTDCGQLNAVDLMQVRPIAQTYMGILFFSPFCGHSIQKNATRKQNRPGFLRGDFEEPRCSLGKLIGILKI